MAQLGESGTYAGTNQGFKTQFLVTHLKMLRLSLAELFWLGHTYMILWTVFKLAGLVVIKKATILHTKNHKYSINHTTNTFSLNKCKI